MRMMLTAGIPHEPFNTLVRENRAGQIIERILEELKPEAVYFTEQHGTRCAVLIIEVPEPSRIPSFAEPFFLHFNADCRFRIVMTPTDLGKAGLEDLGRKWPSKCEPITDKQVPDNSLVAKDVYAQAGEAHRAFMDWRHKTFAGYLAVMATLALAFYQVKAPETNDYWIIICFAGIVMSVAFWMFDFRNRELLYGTAHAAADMEKETVKVGVYDYLGAMDRHLIGQGRAFDVVIVLAIAGLTSYMVKRNWSAFSLIHTMTALGAPTAACVVFAVVVVVLFIVISCLSKKRQQILSKKRRQIMMRCSAKQTGAS